MPKDFEQSDGERYRRLLERVHDWVWEIDENAVITYSSPRVRRLLGYEPEEMIGKKYVEFMPAGELEKARREFQFYSSLKETVSLHRDTFLHKDGRMVVLENSATPIIDEKGKLRGYTVNSCDVTDRVHAESMLRSSEEKYEVIFEDAPVALFLHDPNTGDITDINQQAAASLGYTIEELSGPKTIDMISIGTPPFTKTEAMQRAQLAAAGHPQTFEWLVRHRDGTIYWMEVSLKRASIAGTTKIIAAVHNITGLKRTIEYERENEARFHRLVQTSAAGIIIFKDTEPIYANPTSERILGYTLLELPRIFWERVHPEHQEDVRKMISLCEKGEPTEQLFFIFKAKNGEERWILATHGRTVWRGGTAVIVTFVDITQQKIAEEALRISEENYRSIFDSISETVILHDPVTAAIIDVNRAGEESLGYTAEELRKMNIGDYSSGIPPYTQEDALPGVQHAAKVGPLVFDWHTRRKDGSLFWVEVHLKSAIIGGQLRVLCMAHNIDERKRAEEALRISEENYRSVFDGVSETIIVHDPETAEILEVNQAAADTFGYSKEEFTNKNVGDFSAGTPPYTQEDAARWVRRAATKGPQVFEWLARNKSGELFWLEVHLKKSMMGGKPRVLCITHDINERKHTDEALHREQAYLNSAFGVLPLPIVFSDLHNVVERANEAGYRFFRENDPDLTEPKNWPRKRFADPVTHALIPDEQTPMQQALQGEATSGEYFIIFPNGKEIPILLNCAPVRIGDEIVAIVWSLQDITPLKEADQAKTQFLAVLSHELMTPLTSIQGYAQAALSDPAIVPQALQSIVRNSKRQHVVLKELLDVSRLLHGKLTIRREANDLWQLAMNSVEEIRPEAKEKGVHLQLRPPAGALPVSADAVRLKESIDNIIANALKFTDAGGRITVAGSREDGQAVLHIKDSGRGMSREELDSLFVPFHQFRRTEKTGGLGLGLTLARGVVELHRGKITADSEGEGKGAEFDIKLPLRKETGRRLAA